MQQSPRQPSALDKKRTVILLRSVVTVSTSYLIIFGDKPLSTPAVAYILAVMLSNIVLVRTPRHWFQEPRFSAGLLLADTAVVLAGLYLTVGCFSQDFLIIYFFTIFLTTATSSMTQIALGAALISSLYGYWLWLTTSHALGGRVAAAAVLFHRRRVLRVRDRGDETGTLAPPAGGTGERSSARPVAPQ